METCGPLARSLDVQCDRCGWFHITDMLRTIIENTPHAYGDKLHLVSGLTKAHWLQTGKPLHLDSERLGQLLASSLVPRTPTQRIDRIVAHAASESSSYGDRLIWDFTKAYPLGFARDGDEFRCLCEAAAEEGLVVQEAFDSPPEIHLRVTLAGWRHAEELEKVGALTDQAFVAMWFADAMDEPCKIAIIPALKATGYRPFCVRYHRHNDKIDNLLVAEIRRSGLLVADFTENRQSVYYEAGLAQGLGIDVVRTCRKDHLDKLHFDTRQYNHVVWENDKLEEFEAELEMQIRATIPGRAAAVPLNEV